MACGYHRAPSPVHSSARTCVEHQKRHRSGSRSRNSTVTTSVFRSRHNCSYSFTSSSRRGVSRDRFSRVVDASAQASKRSRMRGSFVERSNFRWLGSAIAKRARPDLISPMLPHTAFRCFRLFRKHSNFLKSRPEWLGRDTSSIIVFVGCLCHACRLWLATEE